MNAMPFASALHRTLIPAFASAAVLLSLTGCSLSTTAPNAGLASTAAVSTLSGTVHGGQQPIYNSTVTLYAAGTSGYGSAATTAVKNTTLATTLTDSGGRFQFTKAANGTSANGATWSCPSSDPNPDPLIYIVAQGGNPTTSGGTSINNTAAALMVALGPCSTITSNTEVIVNEITTVATVFALAQYINPGSTPGGETIGTSNTTQGTVGLNNAFSTIQNLASISGGVVPTAPTYTGTNASVTGVTVTATAESAKLLTIANILATCINTTTSTSAQCTKLFAAATPPPVASVTSQPGATFSTAQDTIQAAYYMAVNPTDAGTQVTTTTCPGSTSNLNCLYNMASIAPQFSGGLGAQPSDWTIGVTFTASGSCTTSSNWQFINAPTKEAVDASGNIWFVNGPSVYATFAGMSPTGQPLACVGNQSAYAGLFGVGIAVDPSGNIWASYSGESNGAITIQELNANAIATATQSTVWNSPYSGYALAIDGSGDIFYGSGSHSTPGLGGVLYDIPNPGATTYTTAAAASSMGATYSTTATFPPTLIGDYTGNGGSPGSGTSVIGYLGVDHNGTVWIVNQTNELIQNAVPTSLTISSFTIVSGNKVTFYTTTAPPSTFGSGTQTIVVNGLTSADGQPMDHQGFTVNSISMSAPYSVTATLNAWPGASANPAPPTLPTFSASVTQPESDTGTLSGYTANNISQTATGGLMYGAALDSSGNLYTGSTCCTATNDKELIRFTPGTNSASLTAINSAAYIGGTNGIRSVTLDGAGNIWFGSVYPSGGAAGSSATNMVGEAYITGAPAFAALSPAGTTPSSCSSSSQTCATGGGFVKSSFAIATDLAVDPSGNLWVPSTENYVSGTLTLNGTNITEVVGAAVPVVTPLSVAASAGTLATKP